MVTKLGKKRGEKQERKQERRRGRVDGRDFLEFKISKQTNKLVCLQVA